MRGLLLFALVVLVGCGDTTGPELTERYRLVQIVEQPVPGARIILSGGERVVVGAGLLELQGDGRYIDELTVCTENGCRDERAVGSYERTGSMKITFWPDGSDNGSTGTIQDGVLTWGVSVYMRVE